MTLWTDVLTSSERSGDGEEEWKEEEEEEEGDSAVHQDAITGPQLG